MLKILREALKITNSNIILTIPLIIFVKVFDLYSAYSRYNLDSMPKLVIASVTVLLMFAVFCPSWLYMIKGAVENSKKIFVLDSGETKASINLFKTMPEGIGKFFLSFIGVYAIFAIIQIVLSPFVYVLGIKLIGSMDNVVLTNTQEMALSAASENNSMAVLIDNLTPEQIVFFAKWSLLFMVLTSVVMFLLMLWIPEILYKSPNPLKALFKSWGKLFKHPFETLRLFLVLWFIGLVILFFNTFSLVHPFAYLFMNVISFYFALFLTTSVFLYYNKRFCSDEQ